MRLHPCEFSVGRTTNAWILSIFKHFFFCAATTMHNGWISVIPVHIIFLQARSSMWTFRGNTRRCCKTCVAMRCIHGLPENTRSRHGTCKPCATRSKRTGGLLDRSTCVLAVPANVHNTILLICLLKWLRVNTTLTESQVKCVQSQ
jgi:hypothetical protein